MAFFRLNFLPVRCFVTHSLHHTKVSVIGSGNWGSTISRIIGRNVLRMDDFDNEVKMFVHEEIVDGQKLSEIINKTHFNVKYLPRHELPPNVVAEPNLVKCADGSDFLVFVVPHQFINGICKILANSVKPTTVGLSLIKGLETAQGGGIDLISHIIKRHLKIEMCVLMGANLAGEIADENFCETTLGCKDPLIGQQLKRIVETDYYRVVVVDDVSTVELCGALKNIVACAAGFVDGLGFGDNTKAAVIRLGLMEMRYFIDEFYPGSKVSTYMESCGVADLITTCYGSSRNRRVSIEFVKTGRPLIELEKELLNGQKMQGVTTAEEVNFMLKNKNKENNFPLFTAVHHICKGQLQPKLLIEAIKKHPAHK